MAGRRPNQTTETYGATAVSVSLRMAGAPSLRTIRLAKVGSPVGYGGSGARYVTSTEGARWVMKAHFLNGQHAYLCLNEAVSAQIAMRLSVSAPGAAVVELDEDQAV